MVPQALSLRSTLFRPTAPLSGNEPPSVYRGKNLILRGPVDAPYFEVFPGNKDLGENYDIGVAPVTQIESATVIAPAGITGDGDMSVVITIRNSEYALRVPVTVATHTTAALIANEARTALAADDYIDSLFIVSGAGANVVLEDREPKANDPSRNIYIQNALVGGCTGITNGPVSANTRAGIGGYRLTGTVQFTADDNTVVGTGTAFKEELHLGQSILAGTQLLVVSSITDDTHFECDRAPDTTESGLTAMRLPQMFEIDGKRGVLMTGNALLFAGRNYVVVGSGELLINGQPLPGSSLWATRRPQAAALRPSTGQYVVQPLGFDKVPPAPEVTVVTGGSGRQIVGNRHSFRVSYWADDLEGTDGYSDPCPAVMFEPDGTTVLEISATDDRFRFDFNPCYAELPPNAKGFVVWASRNGAKTLSVQGATTTTISTNQTFYENGPWYRVAKFRKAELDFNPTPGVDFVEYVDGDLYGEVTGDNNRPADAEFVQRIEGKPMYCSCFGERTSDAPLGTSPGSSCVVSKFDNPDGAPVDWSAECNGTIVGAIEGVGRWFMMTSSNIDFIVPTGLYGQTTQGGRQVELPIVARPYWKTGAKNRYSIVLTDETLIGFSGNKLFRSLGYGDENVKKYDFGAVVADITRTFTGGHVLVCEDPANGQVCVVHAGAYKNDAGYWVSRILPYSVDINAWLPEVVLTDETRDMIVSGVATVDQKLEFLCGGRVQGGTFQVSTYRYAAGNGENPVPYYLAWNFTDNGAENIAKQIHSVATTGKYGSFLQVQVHGTRKGGEIDIADLEQGTNALYEISFAGSAQVKDYLPVPVRFKRLSKYSIRIAGEWPGGSGMRDRIEELVIAVSGHGRDQG